MGRSIQEMYNKFKSILEDDAFFYTILIVLVSVTSFGLGRWSMMQNMPHSGLSGASVATAVQNAQFPTIQSREASSLSTTTQGSLKDEVQQQYVASKNGTKYHLLWCPGAKQIKEENKVYFNSKVDAQKAGYTPASNCKGI